MNEVLDLSQNLQTVQRLSPRQVQFARLLEMTAPEFEEEVQRQIDDNPALEVAAENEPADGHDMEGDDGAIAERADFDPDDDPIENYSRPSSATEYTWQIPDEGPELNAYLANQLGEMELPEPIDKIALYIAGNVDANGYISRSLSAMANDIAITTGIDATPEQMREAFQAVRRLEPAGVGAIDLRDCILLQLRRIPNASLSLKIAIEIVENYFDLLSKKHYDRLQSLLGLKGNEELRKALDLIKTLNPKPGSIISGGVLTQKMAQLTPDVGIDVDGNRVSVWVASSIPQLQIEKSFEIDAAAKPKTRGEREAQAFIKLKRDDAEAFIMAIKQRNSTLMAVSEAIARRQIDFFRTGDQSLIRPMVLRDISGDTGFDLSVISRATAGKYVATEMGIFPLKMFFNESAANEPDTSSHQLMHLMREIIEAEDKNHPLSDREIQSAMEAKGVTMARRTVTKYREKLGLPVGRLRKKI